MDILVCEIGSVGRLVHNTPAVEPYLVANSVGGIEPGDFEIFGPFTKHGAIKRLATDVDVREGGYRHLTLISLMPE